MGAPKAMAEIGRQATVEVDDSTGAVEHDISMEMDGSVMTEVATEEAGLATPESLAAIPEVALGASVTGSSKRRALSIDDDSVTRAAKIKAGRNLQEEFAGNITAESFLHVPNVSIAASQNNIGVSIGSDINTVNQSIDHMKQIEQARLTLDHAQDLRSTVFDKLEKEMEEDDEVDRLILTNLCHDIMDEVMDQGSEHIFQARTGVNKSTTSSKSKKKATKKKTKSV